MFRITFLAEDKELAKLLRVLGPRHDLVVRPVEELPSEKANNKGYGGRDKIENLALAKPDTVMRGYEIAALLPGIGWSKRSYDHAVKSLIKLGRLKKVGVGKYKVIE